MESIRTKTYCEKWPSGCLMCDLLLCDGKKMVGAKSYKPMTNADRIRAMTDEELAEQLYLLRLDALRLEGYEGFIETQDEVLDWLKEEADNE